MQHLSELLALGPIGSFESLDGEIYYRISGYDRMPPFFMTLSSDSDLWMFVTSRGGLTAGRVNADGALFPYETVDKLQNAHGHSGPMTLIRVVGEGDLVWRPFDESVMPSLNIERNLYKNALGNRLVFEEVNHALGLTFRARWAAADALGWVRTATLLNRGAKPIQVEFIDGLRNVLPFGPRLTLMQQASCLVDAYKQAELDPGTGMAIFALTSRIIDRPEAAEQLRANTVWCTGLDSPAIHLSEAALDHFRAQEPVQNMNRLCGGRGNYLVQASATLTPDQSKTWHLVANVGRSQADIVGEMQRLKAGADRSSEVDEQLDRADAALTRILGAADGLQQSARPADDMHHLANTLFNVMRGGTYASNHDVSRLALAKFLNSRNVPVAERTQPLIASLPQTLPVSELYASVSSSEDSDLRRLCYEYLPLHFGRRHGDPSRPWNQFSIGISGLHYEGNWRDIFQNWEALSLSFPDFLPGIVAKFVNASTADGFNPYRITNKGIDWEVPDADDPWSYIGYWGDHQIIYLLKFLEMLPRTSPGVLEQLLEQDVFSYANVPYRIRPYADIVANPHDTIEFDSKLAEVIERRVAAMGSDGKLILDASGEVYHVTLFEKLLVPMLSKLSNFVPDGGIWMNTQRPEWNDANNALVGDGLSMVTLCYLRRYMKHLQWFLQTRAESSIAVSLPVERWFRRVGAVLRSYAVTSGVRSLRSVERRELMNALGEAFSDYRYTVYDQGFSTKKRLPVRDVLDFLKDVLPPIEETIEQARRDDGLFASYNLLDLSGSDDEAHVRPLYEMLEGQVAVLSSGLLSARESVDLLNAMQDSALYRPQERSYLLYPERRLPGFLEKNRIPESRVEATPLLGACLRAGHSALVVQDAQGTYRFAADLASAGDVAQVLDAMAGDPRWKDQVQRDRVGVLEVFEQVFHHRSFTGRSGTMYAYEGLGCIYWHMVAKLLLAVQETLLREHELEGASPEFRELVRAYYRVRSGLGFEKTAAEYGAFPTDPYSHTPPQGGAQQPGMTGQVKEELLTRLGELGVYTDEGQIYFSPKILRVSMFREEASMFQFTGLDGEPRSIQIPANSLGFTFCQVPVIYQVSDKPWVRVTNGTTDREVEPENRLTLKHSRMVLSRSGKISRIDVGVPRSVLLDETT